MKRNISINKKKPSIKVIPIEKQNLKQLEKTLRDVKLPGSPFPKSYIEKVENLIARKNAVRKAKRADKKYEAAKSRSQAAKTGFDRPR